MTNNIDLHQLYADLIEMVALNLPNEDKDAMELYLQGVHIIVEDTMVQSEMDMDDEDVYATLAKQLHASIMKNAARRAEVLAQAA